MTCKRRCAGTDRPRHVSQDRAAKPRYAEQPPKVRRSARVLSRNSPEQSHDGRHCQGKPGFDIVVKSPAYNEKHKDVLILAGMESYWVHRHVLFPQSLFFEKALSGAFMEAQTNQIRLQEDPDLVLAAIQFMYLGAYSNFGNNATVTSSSRQKAINKLVFDIRLHSLADRLLIPELKCHVRANIVTSLPSRLVSGLLLDLVPAAYDACPPAVSSSGGSGDDLQTNDDQGPRELLVARLRDMARITPLTDRQREVAGETFERFPEFERDFAMACLMKRKK